MSVICKLAEHTLRTLLITKPPRFAEETHFSVRVVEDLARNSLDGSIAPEKEREVIAVS